MKEGEIELNIEICRMDRELATPTRKPDGMCGSQ
jgi:hypothetical protein